MSHFRKYMYMSRNLTEKLVYSPENVYTLEIVYENKWAARLDACKDNWSFNMIC